MGWSSNQCLLASSYSSNEYVSLDALPLNWHLRAEHGLRLSPRGADDRGAG